MTSPQSDNYIFFSQDSPHTCAKLHISWTETTHSLQKSPSQHWTHNPWYR